MYYLQDRSVVTGAFLNNVGEYKLAKKKLQIEIDYDSDELALRDKCAEIPYGKPGHPSATELSVFLAEQQPCSKDAAFDLEAEPDVAPDKLDKPYTVCSIYAMVSVGSTEFAVNEMIVDTAAFFNIIDEDFFRLLGNKVGNKLCFVQYTQGVAGVGTGGKTIGHLYLDVSPGIRGGATKTLKLSVMPGLGRPILLGTPGLDLLNIVPDVRNKLCTYDIDVGETELTPMKTTIGGTTREWPCAEALLDHYTPGFPLHRGVYDAQQQDCLRR
ncbi:hypothetical protein HDU90_001464 [Geranomyces variabilis]|nr:hypothetical protein HDU90_001464 [Geranomyces variabilis]